MALYRHKPGANRAPGTAPYARSFDVRRLWLGGAVAAVAGLLVALIGFLVVRTALELPILGVTVYDGVNEPSVLMYGLVAVLCAVGATALMHMLLAGSPRPFAYFRWIFGLALVLAALLPVFASDDHPTGLATAIVNVVIGGAIWIAVVVAAKLALRA